MPVDALGLFDAADDSSKDSSRRKRPYLNSDTNALLGNVLYPKEEEESAKRQKTDCVATRKLNADQWDTMFLRLAAYKAEKGDCLVPKRYAPDPKLGTWVETQRVQYKRLQREYDAAMGVEQVQPNKRLDQTRLEKLNSIGFVWSAKTPRKPSPLQDSSANQENTTAILPKAKPKKPNMDGKELVSRHVARGEDEWTEMYERLVKYKEEHGDTLVPRKYDPDPRLGAWVEMQRVLWSRDFRETGDGTSEPKTGGQIDDAPELVNHETGRGEEKNLSVLDRGAAMECPDSTEDCPRADNNLQHTAEAPIATAINVDLESMNLPTELKRLSVEKKQKLDELGFVWSLRSKRIDDHWDEMFGQLVEYKNKHGDCLVPSRYEENLKLGKWVETQRYEYTKLMRVSITESTETNENKRASNPRLTEERRRRLESIGFEWKVRNKMKRYYDKQWDQMFDRLVEFKAKQGHCLVPKRYPDDMKLGTWVHTQRIQNRKLLEGKKNNFSENNDDASQLSDQSEDEICFRLTEDRRKRLADIGFVWSVREAEHSYEASRIVRTSYDDQWDAMFNLLSAYKERYGDCLVPKRYTENPKLGTWVDTQRVQYKKMKKRIESDAGVGNGISVGKGGGRLTEQRIRRLEDIGFVWSLRDDWQKHYDELIEFKRENGHCNVPARYSNNRRLGIWVSAQRQQYRLLQRLSLSEQRNVRLNAERISLLNNVGFTWTIRSRAFGEEWNQRLRELKHFQIVHGHCNVPIFYHDNSGLGSWVEKQRKLYHQYMAYIGTKIEEVSDLEPPYCDEKIRILDEIGFDWTDRMDQSCENSSGIDALQKASSLASAQLSEKPSAHDHLYDSIYYYGV